MARRIQFQGKLHDFPDAASDDQIRAALTSSAPVAAPVPGMEQLGALPPMPASPKPAMTTVAVPSAPQAVADVTLGALGRGIGNVVEGTGGAMRAVGAETVGKAVADAGAKLSEEPAWLAEASQRPDWYTDPATLTNMAFEGAGSSLASFLPGVAAGRVAGVARVLPVDKWRQLAQYAAGTAAGTLFEAATDAGSAYNEALPRVGPDKARALFRETMLREIPTTMASNALGEFAPRVDGSLGKKLRQGVQDAVLEGGEEAAQGVAQRSAENAVLGTNKPLTDGVGREFVGGALGGAVMSGGRAVANRVAGGGETKTNAPKTETKPPVSETPAAESETDPAGELTQSMQRRGPITPEMRAEARDQVAKNPALAEVLAPLLEEPSATQPPREMGSQPAEMPALPDNRSSDVSGAPAQPGVRDVSQVDGDPASATPTPPKYDYASTQVNLPEPVARHVLDAGARIPDADLAEDGREDEPHVTVKYGLHEDNVDAVRKVLAGEGPVRVKFGKASLFQNEDADVLKVDVESEDLARLHEKIASALPNTETHPKYTPHVTIAYLKPGAGQKYAGKPVPGISGTSMTLNSIAFSDRNRQKTEIPLGPMAAAHETDLRKTRIAAPDAADSNAKESPGLQPPEQSRRNTSRNEFEPQTGEKATLTSPPRSDGKQDTVAASPQDNVQPPQSAARAVKVLVPGEDTAYDGQYEVRDMADVQPSHNPQSFAANPRYAHRNDRDYADPQNAARVIENAGPKFNPEYLLSDSPTAEHGAPVIDEGGNVLGGNNRTMTLARVYQQNPQGATAYRKMLEAKASEFGIDAATVAKMKRPVLVRRVSAADPQSAITDLNKKGSASLRPAEQAVTDGRRMSAKTVQRLVSRIEDQGEGASLADALRGEDAVEVVDALIADGVVTEQEKAGLLDDRDYLTAEAKSRIAKALVGRLFPDAATLNRVQPAMRNKLERIAPSLLRIEGRDDWELPLKDAMAALEEARARKTTLDDLAGQRSIDAASASTYTPQVIAIAKKLQDAPTKVAAAFRRYANDEALSRDGAQAVMFEPPTPQESFADAFLADDNGFRKQRLLPNAQAAAGRVTLKRDWPDAQAANVPGVVYVNAVMKNVLADSFPEALGGNWDGVTVLQWQRPVVMAALREAPAKYREFASQLMKEMEAAAPGDQAVALVVANGAQEQTERHERLHLVQDELGPGFDAERFFRDATAQKARAGLRRLYGEQPLESAADEVAAFVFSGEWAALGLNEREAFRVADVYTDVVMASYDRDAVAKFAGVAVAPIQERISGRAETRRDIGERAPAGDAAREDGGQERRGSVEGGQRAGGGEGREGVRRASRVSARPFYSQLERTLEEKMPAMASGAQIEAIVRNPQNAVKPDELRWTGFLEWIAERAKGGKIAKGAALEFVKANSIELVERFGGNRFADYTLPGGENYRELLMVWPQKTGVERLGDGKWAVDGREVSRDEAERVELERSRPAYDSSHWQGVANVLAHVRFNERTDAEGRRVLHVEEIQSDWHQEGRRKGYKNVPEAPFAKTWHEMAFRRMVRWAAEQGFDAITWPTGEQRADRYDLSTQIDRLKVLEGNYESAGGAGYRVTAWKDGREVIEKDVPRDELPDVIGKEMADKALTAIEENKRGPVPKYAAEFSGLQLKVGGEGMRGFYDDILVKYAAKFGRRFGASVTTAAIEVPASNEYGLRFSSTTRGRQHLEEFWRDYDVQMWYTDPSSEDEFPALAGPTNAWNSMFHDALQFGIDESEITAIVEDNQDIDGNDLDQRQEDALVDLINQRLREIYKPPSQDLADVHSLPITPAMRDSVLAGQPLFAKRDQPGLFSQSDETASRDAATRDQQQLQKQQAEAIFSQPMRGQFAAPKGGLFDDQRSLWDALADDSGTLDLNALRAPQVAALYLRAAELYGRGKREFSAWSAAMLREFGQRVKPLLSRVWKVAQNLWNDDGGEFRLAELTRAFERRVADPRDVWRAIRDQLSPLEVRIGREPGGAEIVRRLNEARVQGKSTGGYLLNRITESGLMQMSDEDARRLLNAMRGTSDTAGVKGYAANRWVTDWIARTAEALDAKVFTNAGQLVDGTQLTLNLRDRGRRDFRGRRNYYPHQMLSADDLRGLAGNRRAQVIEWTMLPLGYAKNRAEAEKMVDEYVDFLDQKIDAPTNLIAAIVDKHNMSEAQAIKHLTKDRIAIRRHGSLEHAREWNSPFYEPDPRRALPSHAASAAMRLAEIAQFGQDNEHMAALVARVAEAGGDWREVHVQLKTILGWAERGNTSGERIARLVQAWNLLKLSSAAVVNSTQVVLNAPAYAGLVPMFRGLAAAVTKDGKTFGVKSGADIERVLRHASAVGTGGAIAERVLRLYGFTQTESFNRRWAANVGRVYVDDLFAALKKKPSNAFLRKRLEELSIDVDAALAAGTLDSKARLRAGLRMSEILNFRSDAASKTEMGNTWIGRVVLQFQGFGYEQTRFVLNRLEDWAEGARNRDAEQLRYAALAALVMGLWWPAWGELIRRYKELAWRKDAKEFDGLAERLFADVASIGGFGVAADYAQAASRKGAIAQRLIGPSLSSGAEAMEAGAAAVKDGDMEKAGRWAVRNLLPFGGPVEAWLKDK